jgi:hypothetical protein
VTKKSGLQLLLEEIERIVGESERRLDREFEELWKEIAAFDVEVHWSWIKRRRKRYAERQRSTPTAIKETQIGARIIQLMREKRMSSKGGARVLTK